MAHDQEFEAFYEAVFPWLVGQLGLVTGDLAEAEDLVQEALARASARWSRLRAYDVPEGWVRRVALNLPADRTRKLRRKVAALAMSNHPRDRPLAADRRVERRFGEPPFDPRAAIPSECEKVGPAQRQVVDAVRTGA